MTMYSFFKISLIAMLVLTTIANYLFIDMITSAKLEYMSLGELLMFIFCIVFETLVIQKLFKL